MNEKNINADLALSRFSALRLRAEAARAASRLVLSDVNSMSDRQQFVKSEIERLAHLHRSRALPEQVALNDEFARLEGAKATRQKSNLDAQAEFQLYRGHTDRAEKILIALGIVTQGEISNG